MVKYGSDTDENYEKSMKRMLDLRNKFLIKAIRAPYRYERFVDPYLDGIRTTVNKAFLIFHRHLPISSSVKFNDNVRFMSDTSLDDILEDKNAAKDFRDSWYIDINF